MNSLATAHNRFLAGLQQRLLAAQIKQANTVAAELAASVSTPDGQPSNPGEPPHSDSGDLVSKITSETALAQDGVTSEIISGSSHSAYQEFGTETLAARPFMRPSMAQQTQEFLPAMAECLKGT